MDIEPPGGLPRFDSSRTNVALNPFKREGFSIFAKALSQPSVNIPQQQLAEAKKTNVKLKDVVDAIKNIPKPAGPGEEF